MIGTVLGLPGYAAITIAFGFTGLGVFIDLNINGLGSIFKGCYFAGCVLAVCWVKRRALFGPMIQPPLLLAIAVPSVVLLSGNSSSGGSGGLIARALSIATPLLNGFPTMAVATAFVLAIGIGRYVMQRPVPTPPPARALPDAGATARRRPPANPRERVRPTDRPEALDQLPAGMPSSDVQLTQRMDGPAPGDEPRSGRGADVDPPARPERPQGSGRRPRASEQPGGDAVREATRRSGSRRLY